MVSEKPWSDYTSADYSIEQWHASCLIHQHEGAPTSKGQCKLPVKTPNGALNRNGVQAAAAALAGARGGTNASSEEKTTAAKALLRYYSELSMKPPPALTSLAHSTFAERFFAHHGIRGQKWGVRRSSPSGSSGGSAESVKVSSRPGKGVVKVSGGGRQPASEDAKRAAASLQKARASSTDSLSNQELSHLNQRLQLEQKFTQLSTTRAARNVSAGKRFIKLVMKTPDTVQKVHSFANSPAGKSIQKAVRQGSGKHAKP